MDGKHLTELILRSISRFVLVMMLILMLLLVLMLMLVIILVLMLMLILMLMLMLALVSMLREGHVLVETICSNTGTGQDTV